MDNLFGSLDLTLLGNLVRNHPELVREVQFKDGMHKLLNVDVLEKRQQDNYGNIATIKASCKKDQQKQDQQKQDQQKQQQDKQQQQKQEPKMSKENAEQLLNAAMQQEKETQERMKKAQQRPQRRHIEKNW